MSVEFFAQAKILEAEKCTRTFFSGFPKGNPFGSARKKDGVIGAGRNPCPERGCRPAPVLLQIENGLTALKSENTSAWGGFFMNEPKCLEFGTSSVAGFIRHFRLSAKLKNVRPCTFLSTFPGVAAEQ